MSAVGLRRRLDLLHSSAPARPSTPRRAWNALAYLAVVAACATATPSRAQSSDAQDVAGWRIYSSPHFQIRYVSEQQDRIEAVADAAERAYARLATGLEYELVRPVSLILVRRNRDIGDIAASLQSLHVRTGTSHQHVVIALEDLDTRADALVHELAHQFTFEIVPQASRAVPWLMEGLAEHQRGIWDTRSVERIRSAVRAGGVPDPDRLTDADAVWGHALFDYIASQSGEEGIRRLLFVLRKDARLGPAIQSALGVEPEAFARGFADYVWTRFGPR